MATVFLNGRFLDEHDQAGGIAVFDAGLLHAVGLFETLLGGCARPEEPGDSPEARQAWALHLEEHLARLAESARVLGLASVLHEGPLGEAVLRTVARSGLPRARVRLTVTGGDLNMLSRPMPGGGAQPAPTRQDPTVLITATPATRYPPAMIDEGVLATIADTRVSPLHGLEGHKTLSYWWRLRELQRAAGKGAGEALVFTTGNHLVGGCVSSTLLIKGGELIAPIARGEEAGVARAAHEIEAAQGREPAARHALASPVLPGITRRWAIDAAAGLGVLARRKMVTIDDVLGADEVMLTNSSWGVLPVVRVEASTIGSGAPGPVTRQLVHAWAGEAESAAAGG